MSTVLEKTTSLYVLVFPERKLLKVGKANNVYTRCEKLKQVWGSIAYLDSFELKAPQSIVFKLEKSLHFMLSAHSANVGNADGYTEMFFLDALDTALKHIELFMASSPAPLTLQKGISTPQQVAQEKKQAAIGRNISHLGVGAIGTIGVMAWAVYCIVKDQAIAGEQCADPPIQKIADLIGVSNDTIQIALATLASTGMLRITKRLGIRNTYSWE